jgi:hypothetical protein
MLATPIALRNRSVKLPAYLHGRVSLVWVVNVRHGVLEEYQPPTNEECDQAVGGQNLGRPNR